MKNLIAGLLVMAVGTANAVDFLPATQTRAIMAPQKSVDFRTRTLNMIAARAAEGYHYARVDMDGATWKQEKALMKELQGLGYEVDFGNDSHTYGWNNINGALIVRWVPRHEEPLFGDR